VRPTEEKSANALADFLCRVWNVKWHSVENDPPDFVFEVENERWAVECTELHQYLKKEDGDISRRGVEKPLESMCERIRAKADAGRNRDYMIMATGPLREGVTTDEIGLFRDFSG
jgi:hypothetical protein